MSITARNGHCSENSDIFCQWENVKNNNFLFSKVGILWIICWFHWIYTNPPHFSSLQLNPFFFVISVFSVENEIHQKPFNTQHYETKRNKNCNLPPEFQFHGSRFPHIYPTPLIFWVFNSINFPPCVLTGQSVIDWHVYQLSGIGPFAPIAVPAGSETFALCTFNDSGGNRRSRGPRLGPVTCTPVKPAKDFLRSVARSNGNQWTRVS